MSYGLLLLRVVVGGTMFGHGAQKLFGWFGGYGPKGTGGFFEELGFRGPVAMAVAAGLAETSGVLLAAGFVTPLAALAIAVVMFNAIWTVHWSKGFWNSNGGLEFPLILATVAVAIAAIGPGRVSLGPAVRWGGKNSGGWGGGGGLPTAPGVSLLNAPGRPKRPA